MKDIVSAEACYNAAVKFFTRYPEVKIAKISGKMKAAEIDAEIAKFAANETLNMLKQLSSEEYKGEKIIVLGPMPARVAKISEKYRYRIIIKCRNTSRFRQMISQIIKSISKESRFSKVTVYADINPDTAI